MLAEMQHTLILASATSISCRGVTCTPGLRLAGHGCTCKMQQAGAAHLPAFQQLNSLAG